MKTALTFAIILFTQVLSFACSCENIPSFCDYTKYIAAAENPLIFLGERIAVDSIDEETMAHQFLLKEKYLGDIITADSEIVSDSPYTNTDSTIWILGGQGSLCLRNIDAGLSIFAVNYSSNYFGYVPNICSSDHLYVNENNEAIGWIYQTYENESIPTSMIQNVISNVCTSSLSDVDLGNQISISPNPAEDVLYISIDNPFWNDVTYSLTDVTGNLILRKNQISQLTSLPVHDLPSGVYILNFIKSDARHSKKLIIQ